MTVRAREWAIAATSGTPSTYDIPELPDWHVCRTDRGGIAFAENGEPFIAADRPVTVRR